MIKRNKLLMLVMSILICNRTYAQTNLFNGLHEDVKWAFTLGYVSKDWRTNINGTVIHENLWGEEDKRMHGIQIGFNYQPCFKFGLGVHTGLFYEFYLSVSKTIKDYGFSDFGEHSLYIPLHGMYRLPITRKMSFNVFGGVGLNYALYGKYSDAEHRINGASNALMLILGSPEYMTIPKDEWSSNRYLHYGNGEWPKHFNLQWEVGGALRYKRWQLGFTYSFGASNHHFYQGYLTRQDKLNINCSVVW